MNIKTQISLGVILLLSLLSPLVYNIVSLSHNCENACDFSIYQQAIYDSFVLKKLNPFLTIRNVHILQDHFDPVFLLAGPWAALFNYSPYSLLVFEWIFLVATLGVLIYFLRDKQLILLWSFLLLWNRGIIHAIGYPLHPTAWSILPITLMLMAIKEKKERLFWFSCLSLFFFKEIFSIATIGLSGGFFLTKYYKKGSILLVISILFCLFNFQWRTYLLEGESLNYAVNFWKPWLDNFWVHLSNFPLNSALKYLLPGTLSLYLIIAKKSFKQEDFLIISFWLPLFFIQSIALRFDYHNSSMLAWPPVLLLWKKEYLFNKKFITILVIFNIYTTFGSHKKNYLHIFNEKIGLYCEVSKNKRESIKKIRSLIFQTPVNSTLLSTGGNIPLILRPKSKVYHMQGYSPLLKEYDYLLLGRKEDFYPLDKTKIEEIWNNCTKNYISKIIFKDNYHLMLKGPVSKDCL